MTTTNYRQSERQRTSPLYNQHKQEGPVARMIEERTAAVPSDMFLWAAGASIGGSVILKMMGRNHDSHFVGQWAPTFLILGLYNKMVKQQGSDWSSRTGGSSY